ncbi:MAG: hypothetical protein S4CHLAM6_13730 [Chlamydiae bacterium]|nr:hypothetical protein [Chlamydiota bacterium]
MSCPCFTAKLSPRVSRSGSPLISQEEVSPPKTNQQEVNLFENSQQKCEDFFTSFKTYTLVVTTDSEYPIGDFGFNGAKVLQTVNPDKIFKVAKGVFYDGYYEESLTITLQPNRVHLHRHNQTATPEGFSPPSETIIEGCYNEVTFERCDNTLTINLGRIVRGSHAPRKYVLTREDKIQPRDNTMYGSMSFLPRGDQVTRKSLKPDRRSSI